MGVSVLIGESFGFDFLDDDMLFLVAADAGDCFSTSVSVAALLSAVLLVSLLPKNALAPPVTYDTCICVLINVKY